MHLDVWVYIHVEGLTEYIEARQNFSQDLEKSSQKS